MPEPLSASQAAAANPIVDNIFALIDQGVDAVGEEALVAIINQRLDIPLLTESMEAVLIGLVVKRIHAAIHKAPTPTT